MLLKKAVVGLLSVLAVVLAGCRTKTPSAEEIKSYQLIEADLRAFAKCYGDVNPTFKNLIPTMRQIGEDPFGSMAKIKFPRETGNALKNTDFQGDLARFLNVYANVKLGIIRILAEEKVKELNAQIKGFDDAMASVDKSLREKKIKPEDAQALKEQFTAQKQAAEGQIAAIKPYTQIEVSQANLELLRKFFFDLSAVLIQAGDYETFD
ncbi:MAG: hypothetical protein ACPL68_00130 [Candidatus Hydrothermia bacterium]